jgi:peptide/nickel transport system permease protein
MGRFVLNRAIHALIVVLGVSVIVFVVTRLVGDPISVMLPLEATPELRAEFSRQIGFDRPIAEQFVNYLMSAAQLDFGESLWQRRPAMEVVFGVLPLTFQLVIPAMILAVALSIPLGILAALRPGSPADRSTTTFSLIGLSVPQFWLALLMIIVFAVQLGWLPTSGTGSWRHAILPILSLALPTAGRLTVMVRSAMIDELHKPYMQMARAKNLPFHRLVGVHAFRNASIAPFTLAGWELCRALAGFSLVVETVFAWPGIGFTAIQALQRGDLILVQAIVFTVAVLVVVINTCTDLVYKRIDPRIELV